MPDRLARLLDRDAQLYNEMESMLATADAEDLRALTEEEDARYGEMEAEREQLQVRIARERGHAEHERHLQAVADWNRAGSDGTALDDADAGGSEDGLSFGERLQLIQRAYTTGMVDPRLIPEQAASGASVGVPSDGGYLVQDEVSTEIIRKTFEEGEFSSRASRAMSSGGVLKIPYVKEESRADGSRYGGVRAYWASEAGTVTASKPELGRLEIELFKLFALGYSTDELLADAPAIESLYRELFPQEMSHKVNDGMYNGTGVGQPLGVLKSTGRVTVDKESGQAAATIQYENVLNMWTRLWARSRMRAAWFVNPDCEAQLAQMVMPIGTGGVPVYLPATGVSGSPYSTLFGRPVIPSEHCAALGTEGDIALADFAQYQLVEHRNGMKADRSAHVRFINDEEVFRWVQRIGGRPKWLNPITPKHSTNTRSPYVFLQTRS